MITDGMGLNITVMSYDGQMDFGIVADRDRLSEWRRVERRLSRGAGGTCWAPASLMPPVFGMLSSSRLMVGRARPG